MGRAARKDAAEDASWRRLPQRVSWRFYPAFEGLLAAARSAVVFLVAGAHAPAARSYDPPSLAAASSPFEAQRGPAVLDDLRSVSRNAGSVSANSGRPPPIVSRNAGPNRPMISGPGADVLRPLHVALEARAGGDVRRRDDPLLVDGEPPDLAGPRAAAPARPGRPGLGRLLHAARPHLGPALQALERRDLGA